MRKLLYLVLSLTCFGAYAQVFNLEPATPSKPTVSLSGLQATISWPPISNANAYYILPIRSGVQLQQIQVGSPHIYNVVAGASYQFRVKACNGRYEGPGPVEPPITIFNATTATSGQITTSNSTEVCSAWSVPSSVVSATQTTPAVPSGLESNLSDSTIITFWSAVSGASSYSIRQRVNGSWQSAINNGNLRHRSFPVTAGNNYQYQVQACSGGQCSNWSSATSVITVSTFTSVDVSYQYDALGRLIYTSDTQNKMSEYEYDDAGNRVLVTKGNQ